MTEITEAVELAKEIVWDLDVRHELIPNQALAQRHAKVLATLLSELTRLQEENGQLRLAICGGEDAPGYADSLPLADILGVAANNLGSWREASDRAARLQEEVKGLRALIDAPELHDFARGVVLEAAHQRKRWGSDHDAGKDPQDWFWLLGYLGGKALRSALDGDQAKALHHTISTAAACANWHAAITGTSVEMRPGVDPAERHLTATLQGQQS